MSDKRPSLDRIKLLGDLGGVPKEEARPVPDASLEVPAPPPARSPPAPAAPPIPRAPRPVRPATPEPVEVRALPSTTARRQLGIRVDPKVYDIFREVAYRKRIPLQLVLEEALAVYIAQLGEEYQDVIREAYG